MDGPMQKMEKMESGNKGYGWPLLIHGRGWKCWRGQGRLLLALFGTC
jgi:hypothetical protein